MKLVHRDLVRNGPGSIKLLPEEEEDLWHAYNLIAAGDTLQAVTVRNSDIATRQKYVSLVESVKKFGGTVHIFSSMHVSGDQLAQLTGIAAILRCPLPDLEDIEM